MYNPSRANTFNLWPRGTVDTRIRLAKIGRYRESQQSIEHLDQVFINDLLVRGIVGINEVKRKNRQDILVNDTVWADARQAGVSDQIGDTVNYRSIAKAIIAHIEQETPLLVENKRR